MDNRSSYLDINSINSFLIASASNLLEPIWNAEELFLLLVRLFSSSLAYFFKPQSQTGLPTSPITKMNLFITSLRSIYLIESNDLKSITFLLLLSVALQVFVLLRIDGRSLRNQQEQILTSLLVCSLSWRATEQENWIRKFIPDLYSYHQ